jgi:hypothetical protein
VSDKPFLTKLFLVLPLLIGMLGGVITGAILSILFPPESQLDKNFYLVVHAGLVGSFGLLCGYLLVLTNLHRIRPFKALLIILFVLLFAILFIFFH